MIKNIGVLDLEMDHGRIRDITTRLQGTTLSDIYGEQTGTSARNLPDLARNRMWASSTRCMERREPVARRLEQPASDRIFLTTLSLYCPLATNGTDIDKILMLLAFRKKDTEQT